MMKMGYGTMIATLLVAGCAGHGEWDEDNAQHGDIEMAEPDIELLRAKNEAGIAEMIALAQQAPPEQIRALVEHEARYGRVDAEASFQEKRSTPLSEEERGLLDAHFAELGVAPESVNYSGRLIVQGDIVSYADDLLAALQTSSVVEKGRTIAQSITFGTPLSEAPDVYSQQVNDQTQFWRPFTGLHFLVLRGSTSQAIFDMVLQAANAITSVPGTSLGKNGNTYNVIKEADYNNLCAECRAFNYKIDVIYDVLANACPSGDKDTVACNVFPRITAINSPLGGTTVRMSLGTRMGIVSTKITGNTDDARGVIMHELFHGLGVAHLEEDQFGSGVNVDKLDVPGTAGASLTVASIMHANINDPNWENTLQPEDIDVLTTLYPAGSGSYVHGFSTITAN